MEKIDVLSQREKEVAALLLEGRSNKQIALALGISIRTVEFHLRNSYGKLQIGSRVELILLLGKESNVAFEKPVESTVASSDENVDNGNQLVSQRRWAQSLRNTVSLIKQEIAMTIRISFEELENYLRNHPAVFSLILLLLVSFTTRYVIFGLGLFHWLSYALLAILLGAGSVYFGLSWKKVTAGKFHTPTRPLVVIGMSILLPLITAGFDQLYINTVLRYTEPIAINIVNISAKAMWLVSPEGNPYRSTQLSIASDALWFIAIGYILILFYIGQVSSTRFNKSDLASA